MIFQEMRGELNTFVGVSVCFCFEGQRFNSKYRRLRFFDVPDVVSFYRWHKSRFYLEIWVLRVVGKHSCIFCIIAFSPS